MRAGFKGIRLSMTFLFFAGCTSQTEPSKPVEVATAQAPKAASIYDQQDKWPGTCQRGQAAEQRQSPIALTDSLFTKSSKNPIKFSYTAADAEILDNGHTIQYRFKGDAGYLMFEGSKYSLKQFHFHKTSEHTLNGKTYDMEVHFVHMKEAKGKNEKPAAVALGFLVSSGASTPDWTKVWDALPVKAASSAAPVQAEHGQATPAHHENILGLVSKINVRSLIPAKAKYLVYEGSLTTPGCDEIVTHVIDKQPIAFDSKQIEKFAGYFPISNRMIQSLGDAKIRKYRTVVEK
ncbi:MAG: carbonic anhydrase family protein [Proteobacteria bacterium]|nr:carbonic anhydrase family protein [Pseudomonadota bacterium]